jgi:hypothetical protein
MVTMGGDLQPDCLADRLLTGLGQPQIKKEKEKAYCSAEKGNHEQVGIFATRCRQAYHHALCFSSLCVS